MAIFEVEKGAKKNDKAEDDEGNNAENLIEASEVDNEYL